MGCGGCAKRKSQLEQKIKEHTNIAESAKLKGEDIPFETKSFLEKNSHLILRHERSKLLSKRHKLMIDKQSIPSELNKKIDDINDKILSLVKKNKKSINRKKTIGNLDLDRIRKNKNYSSGEIKNKTTQNQIIHNIMIKGEDGYIPVEFDGIVEPIKFNPDKDYKILSEPLTSSVIRDIRRKERVYRRRLVSAIERGDEYSIKRFSKEYSEKVFDLYLLVKRETKNKEV